MSIDLSRSRREFNEFCKWFSREYFDSLDKITHDSNPTGVFYAKEVSAETFSDSVLGGSFMFDKQNTVIQSPDDLHGIKPKDIVLYQGEYWFVTNVQKKKFRMQNSEFAVDRHCSHDWYIEIRK